MRSVRRLDRRRANAASSSRYVDTHVEAAAAVCSTDQPARIRTSARFVGKAATERRLVGG
jgi:hypothetical protein